ncbi:MAG: DUF6084 family protein [Thermoleophilaceae bacterium]
MIPDPEFWVLDARPVPHSAAPTLSFRMRVRDRSERDIYTIALVAQINLDLIERPHEDGTRERLRDVFGEPERWGDTGRGVLWAKREVLVPSFTGSTSFELQVPCNSDLELATTRYLEALPDGEAPFSFHFSGSIVYAGDEDRLQLARVPWHVTAQFRLPVDTWRRAVGGSGGLVRVGDETFEALRRHRIEQGLYSLDAAVADLLKAVR